MTILLTSAALLGSAGRTLAQNTPEENNPNVDAPFVRNIRADRPGQTITAQVLRPGRFQLETGVQRASAGQPLTSVANLRVGFFNGMELRINQPYFHGSTLPTGPEGRPQPAGWAPLLLGAKLMVSPNYDTRTQVAVLVESTVPNTGAEGRRTKSLAPSARLLVSEQLGERFGLEGNFGFSQKGLTVADLEAGQFLGSLALNGPLGSKAGFFAEVYGQGRSQLTSGFTTGLYYRPAAALRFDVAAGRVLGGRAAGAATLGAGLSLKLGR